LVVSSSVWCVFSDDVVFVSGHGHEVEREVEREVKREVKMRGLNFGG
jgi:hypothetical protein